jgi:hypothetical protein
VEIIDVRTGRMSAVVDTLSAPQYSGAAFDRAGNVVLLTAGSVAGTAPAPAELSSTRGGEALQVLPTHALEGALSPDGKLALTLDGKDRGAYHEREKIVVPVLAAGMVWLGVFAGGAWGASVNLCVPSTAGGSVVSNGTATSCTGQQAGDTPVALPSTSTDQQTLISILPHITFTASGIGGEPTIKFSGVNVQIVSGSGATNAKNGEGNLVLGHDESPGTQSGSHDLVLGEDQTYTGFGELVGGFGNTVGGPFASAFGYRKSPSSSALPTISPTRPSSKSSWCGDAMSWAMSASARRSAIGPT